MAVRSFASLLRRPACGLTCVSRCRCPAVRPDQLQRGNQSLGAFLAPPVDQLELLLDVALLSQEAKNEQVAEEAEVVKLYCQVPPINKLDNSLNTLKNCTCVPSCTCHVFLCLMLVSVSRQLSLSTNSIDRLIPLAGMKALRILSLGRNQLKKIEKLDDVADSLEELWLSYNQIASLDGCTGLSKLQVLYISNNNIKSWSELDNLVSAPSRVPSSVFVLTFLSSTVQANLPDLRDVLFFGNPIYENLSRQEQRIEVLKKLPNLQKIDGDMVKPAEREEAAAADE